VATPSIQTKLDWLVVLCALPVTGLVATLLYAELSPGTAFGLPAAGELGGVLWWWGLASAALLVGGLAFAQRLARQITSAMHGLAESAASLAEGRLALAPPMPMKEAEEVAAALARAAALLRERTAERDRAARAEAFLRREQGQLEHQATHDVLTGLMNRQRFDTVIHERVVACDRDRGELTLLYIDVDGFKRINDLHGHAIGDELLRLFAARMKAGVRESEVVARLGGDEFAVILDHAMPAQTLKTADGLIDRLSRPYRVGPLMVEVSASIGLAAYPASGTCARTLLEAADEAMYRAKRGGKCRHVTSGFAPL